MRLTCFLATIVPHLAALHLDTIGFLTAENTVSNGHDRFGRWDRHPLAFALTELELFEPVQTIDPFVIDDAELALYQHMQPSTASARTLCG